MSLAALGPLWGSLACAIGVLHFCVLFVLAWFLCVLCKLTLVLFHAHSQFAPGKQKNIPKSRFHCFPKPQLHGCGARKKRISDQARISSKNATSERWVTDPQEQAWAHYLPKKTAHNRLSSQSPFCIQDRVILSDNKPIQTNQSPILKDF